MTQEEIPEKLIEVEQRGKSNTKRLDRVEKKQENLERLTNSLATMQNEQEHIKEDVGEIKADVRILAEKPARRWESVVEKVITVVVGAMVGYLLSGVGM